MTDKLTELLSKLEQVRPDGDGWKALCPSHADRNPSLRIDLKNEKILLKCFAGCTTEAICAAVGIAMRDLYLEPAEKSVIVATYDYTDEKGRILFQAVRYEPKDFKQRKPDGKGGWLWKLGDVRRVLYRLPEVLAASDVLIVEGEKDVETARKLGFVATTNMGGAGKWKAEYSASLLAKDVTVIADADEPGRNHARQVASALYLRAASLKVIEKLPSLFDAKDLTEWVAEGNDADALRKLIAATPEWNPDATAASVSAVDAGPFYFTIGAFLQRAPDMETVLELQPFDSIEAKPVSWLWRDRIPHRKLTVFSGDPDCGKTCVLIDVIARFTSGRGFPDAEKEIEPGSVLILNAEDDPGDTLKPRLIAAGADLSRIFFVKGITIRQGAKKAEREFAFDSDLKILEDKISERPEIALVAVDPVSNYLGKVNIDRTQEVRRVLAPLQGMCDRKNVGTIALLHFSKRSDVSALGKVGGSVATTAVARSVLLFSKVPNSDTTAEPEYVMCLGKGNLTKRKTGLSYKLVDNVQPTGTVPVVQWDEKPVTDSANSLLSPATTESNKPDRKTKATAFLREYLADGARKSSETIAVAKFQGISGAAVFEAKERLGARSFKSGGEWWMELPADNPPPEEPEGDPEPDETLF